MPTYKKASPELIDLANDLIREFGDHAPLADRKVKIDFLFAFPDYHDTTGEPINNALTKGGCKALGITRKVSLKDRAKGLGDAEICIDGDWWESHDLEEQRALLDHELHHIAVSATQNDDLGRPVIKLRKHDLEFGWFNLIAQRHGQYSQERIQAQSISDNYGQFYWPALYAAANPTSRVKSLELVT